VSFTAITLCVASQLVFVVASIYFVMDSVGELLNTSSYSSGCFQGPRQQIKFVMRCCVRSEIRGQYSAE
jgi:hypothetical protein